MNGGVRDEIFFSEWKLLYKLSFFNLCSQKSLCIVMWTLSAQNLDICDKCAHSHLSYLHQTLICSVLVHSEEISEVMQSSVWCFLGGGQEKVRLMNLFLLWLFWNKQAESVDLKLHMKAYEAAASCHRFPIKLHHCRRILRRILA